MVHLNIDISISSQKLRRPLILHSVEAPLGLIETRQLVLRPLKLGGEDLPQYEGGPHEDAPDEKQEGKGHRGKAKLLGGSDRKVLQALVVPCVPHPVLEPALVELVQPVVEEVSVLGVGLQPPSCDD